MAVDVSGLPGPFPASRDLLGSVPSLCGVAGRTAATATAAATAHTFWERCHTTKQHYKSITVGDLGRIAWYLWYLEARLLHRLVEHTRMP